jgi:hypothetical protein
MQVPIEDELGGGERRHHAAMRLLRRRCDRGGESNWQYRETKKAFGGFSGNGDSIFHGEAPVISEISRGMPG